MVEWLKSNGPITPEFDHDHELVDGGTDDMHWALLFYRPFPMPYHLPSSFAQEIREITQGTSSTILFKGDPGELWDLDKLISETTPWTLEEWRNNWWREVVSEYFDLPSARHPGGVLGLPSRYFIQTPNLSRLLAARIGNWVY
ncbi:hypothetical protein K458DRAFT_416275 [Lentithecium fluviatile CBS 122367]|uniref:Uncharacterized protein n=1 Tax=Lentithecium fluviatile CBS 122367 TaxID=1168545 RepID=A0A6G1J9P8_9PLEO|nr:hypothetical protein K458DRAFT_416275 [Lentithecium fluviatile CBS 122367]